MAQGLRTQVTWRVQGMDCAACVAKVTRAVERLPGVSEVAVNLMAERMTARLEPALGDPAAVEAAVGALGYGTRRLAEFTPAAAPATAPACGCGGDHGAGGQGHAAHDRSGHDHGAHDHAGHDHAGHGHAAHDHADHGHAAHGPATPATATGAAGAGTVAHGHDHDDPAEAHLPWWRTAKARLFFALAGLAAGAWVLARVFPAAEAWIYGLATLVAVSPFARRALALARAGTPFSIETLMVVASLGAVAIGAAEEAAAVVVLFALGELLEGVAAGSARAGIRALLDVMPRTARRRLPDGTVEEVQAGALRPGDLVLLRPGERAACDGVVTEGRSAMDESPVTGESVPVERGAGDPVLGGSVSTDGALALRVTRAGEDSTLARIAALVAEATASRGRSQRFVERFAAWWTPAAMGAAALVALVPPLLGWGDWGTWIYRGLALLLVACPCALVISVPAAMASGLSAGARRGLLVKGGAALEALGTARIVAFDKTGTLTEGRPRLTAILTAAGVAEDEALSLAAAVERESAHPLARAILRAAEERGLAIQAVTEAGAEAGRGVRGTVAGRALVIGHPRFAASLDAGGFAALAPFIEAREAEGHTLAVLVEERPGDSPRALAALALRDEPRADAVAGVAAVRALGLRPVMLTGDNRRAGAAIAASLGLEARAELRPEDKLREIAALRAEGPVLMVGDGINDAPALAAATAGIAMGGGTETALEAADAAVLRDRVPGVAELVALSRATLGNVRQNVAVALGLKAVFLVTTVAGITGLWPAILADTGATVLVTLNALRLLRWTPPADLVPAAEVPGRS